MSTFRKVTYRAGLFDPENLSTNDGIAAALTELSGVLTKSNLNQVLDGVLDKGHVVELILSGLTDEIPVKDWILEQFPSSALSFEASFSYKLLSKLSQFFLFNAADDEMLRNNHQTVRFAPEILQSLLAFSNIPNNEPVNSHSVENTQRFKAKKSSQKEMKRGLKANRNLSLNGAHFKLAGVTVPKTPSDAIATVSDFLGHLKDILKLYLDKMRSAPFLSIIQESFIPKQCPVELRIDTTLVPLEDELPPSAPTTTTIATAFPIVQPLKSALYFDTPDGFGKWNILISQRADRALRGHRRKGKASYDIIVKKMKELSNGHFSYDNQKRLNGPNTEIPIYEAKLSSDLRLVYQVDWVPGHDLETETQVLRIYGIYTHAQMDNRLWNSVSSQLSKRGREYRKRCLERKKQDGDVYLPVSSPAVDEDTDDYPPTIPDLPPDEGNQLHNILTLEKYVTLSKELLDSIEADRDATFPFEVSKYENKIIQHPSSCYVLGRSGTGKTTTMLFKMLWVERAYQMSSEQARKPRQAFVTQSRVLAGKVEELFASYLTSLSSASQIEMDQRLARFTKRQGEEGSRDENDDSVWEAGLPKRFSELEDRHFPLFLTLDRLYTMLEADIKHLVPEAPDVVTAESFHVRDPSSPWPAPTPSGKRITYDRFLGEYWPHFTQSLKRNFNPSLVFSEFIGIIQGSEKSSRSPNGFLDRRTYEDLSTRTQPTFSEYRSDIYTLYESYRKIKNELGDFDAADRTHAIIRAISKRQGILGDTFDFVYVDETQDNLLVDSLVLRMLCRNNEGLFWAGDTAQTIYAGSAFRFEDLTAFLFQFEKQRRLDTHTGLQLPTIERKKQKKPTMFHLAVNYRSHSGIVNCAHAVIEIISKYWRNSIDVLPRERGNTDGTKPIFFKDVYPGFMRGGHFLSQKRDSHDKIELGADQCILVRDEAAKQRLESELGKIGIIITIYDSKGLEFNDVFLYNFFHDSSVEASQWRVVLNCLSPDALENRPSPSAPTFNPVRHAAICSELKSLYVAITRARNTLRIADESLKGEPMRAFWEHNSQIRSCRPDDDLSDFAVPSSKDEWANRALELSRNQKFDLARDSYEKAGNLQEAAFQNAHYLCQLATRTPSGSRDRRRELAFLSAAKAFQSCAESASRTQRKNICYLLSADCFEQANEILLAAKTYKMGEDFTKASRLFRKLGMFDDVHEIILKHAQKLDDLESIRDVTRLYYVNQRNFEKAHQLFPDVEEEIEYLADRELDLAQLDLLLLHGRKFEAVDLHLSEGRVLEAIDLLVEDGPCDINSTKRASECILQGLWQNLPVGVMVSEKSELFNFNEYLNRFNALDQGYIDPCDLHEFEMFQAIASCEFGKLEQLGKYFREAGRTDAAFLCFDYFYMRTPVLETVDITELASSLRQFLQYVEVLHEFAFIADPLEPRILKIFGVKRSGDNFFVPPTALHSHFRPHSTEDGDIPQVLVKDVFLELFRTQLKGRLLDRVTRESDVCRKAFALSICLRHVLPFSECDSPSCTRTHVSPDSAWLRNWISVHFLQILIYDTISPIQFPAQMQSERRYWIRKLHEAFNPPHCSLGPPYRLDCNLGFGVDTRKAIGVVIDWAKKISFDLGYWPASSFLTIAMQTADLAFTLNKKEASVYVYRLGYINSPETPSVFFRERGENILQELLVSFNGKGPTSLLMGILFIRRVVEAQIPVDINVFCSFIERICTLIVMFNRYRYSQNLDTVILPRGWIALALRQFDSSEASQQDSSRFWLMLEPLHEIIIRIYFCQSEHLLFGHDMRSISSQGTTVRSVYISRIYRVLGLLGSNIRVTKFQAEIHSKITSLLRKPHHGFPRIYASYIYAENFLQIAKSTRRSMQGSSLDEMVQLLHSAHLRRPVHEIFGLRRIVYTKEEDLIPLLSAQNEAQPSESDPSTLFSNLDNDVEIPHEFDVEDALIDKKDIENAEEADPNFIPETEIPKDVYVGHTAAELEAASIMQKFGRNVVERMRLMRSHGLNGEVRRQFSLCLNHAMPSMKHGFPRYQPIYLGFIPPLIACFDAIVDLISTRKISLKNRMISSIGHEELDEVSRTLTRINFILKSIKRHKNTLRSESEFHRRVEVDALKKQIRACLDLMSDLQLPMELPADIQTELHLIHKGVVRESKPPRQTQKNPKRPALNWEDDDETEYLA